MSGRTYDKLAKQPLGLVTLALDYKSSQQLWKKSLIDTYAQGEHVYLDKKLSSEIYEYFQLPPVPCYLYFDKNSNYLPYKIFSIKDVDIDVLLSEG
ncbi:hypothetical protein [Portibacter marinus]|uniref:hypothetical protein n=1 Tax=Portibacter marinus TaxID=2898660 RepID=UPI001F297042|nr:hypothetical protein [Portibacter marinus]